MLTLLHAEFPGGGSREAGLPWPFQPPPLWLLETGCGLESQGLGRWVRRCGGVCLSGSSHSAQCLLSTSCNKLVSSGEGSVGSTPAHSSPGWLHGSRQISFFICNMGSRAVRISETMQEGAIPPLLLHRHVSGASCLLSLSYSFPLCLVLGLMAGERLWEVGAWLG